MRGEQQHNGQPEDASPWQRGCDLRRHVHDRGLRRDGRGGIRDLLQLRGLLRPMGKKGAHQRPRRIGPRQRKRHKQPQRRQIPQRDKHAPGQAAPARRAQQRRQRDGRAGGKTPLHKRHGRPLFSPFRRSSGAAAQAAPGSRAGRPGARRRACPPSRRTPCRSAPASPPAAPAPCSPARGT